MIWNEYRIRPDGTDDHGEVLERAALEAAHAVHHVPKFEDRNVSGSTVAEVNRGESMPGSKKV